MPHIRPPAGWVPGAAIDRLIAERVMGWKPAGIPGVSEGELWIDRAGDIRGTADDHRRGFHPSEDAASLDELLRELGRQGWRLVLEVLGTADDDVPVFVARLTRGKELAVAGGAGSCEAWCRAALEAAGGGTRRQRG